MAAKDRGGAGSGRGTAPLPIVSNTPGVPHSHCSEHRSQHIRVEHSSSEPDRGWGGGSSPPRPPRLVTPHRKMRRAGITHHLPLTVMKSINLISAGAGLGTVPGMLCLANEVESRWGNMLRRNNDLVWLEAAADFLTPSLVPSR